MQAWIESYLVAQKRAVDSLQPAQLVQLVETLKTAHGADRQIFVVGNGGSAANASHFAVDLGKGASDKLGRRFRVLSLCDNTPWLTALGNDYSYDEVFVRQLQNFARAIEGTEPLLITAEDGVASVKAVEAAYASLRQNHWTHVTSITTVIQAAVESRSFDF